MNNKLNKLTFLIYFRIITKNTLKGKAVQLTQRNLKTWTRLKDLNCHQYSISDPKLKVGLIFNKIDIYAYCKHVEFMLKQPSPLMQTSSGCREYSFTAQ